MLKPWHHVTSSSTCGNSTRFRMQFRKDPFTSPEAFIVCRVNPLFAAAEPPRNFNEEMLHVRRWCSTVCPRHMVTCCVCKPVLTYCDNCVGLLLTRRDVMASAHVYEKITSPEVAPKALAAPPPSRRNRHLEVYMNSNYVSEIAVASTKQQSGTGSDCACAVEASVDSDSLESLRIDERMFSAEESASAADKSAAAASISQQEPETDADIAYEAIRDLHEKMSRNKQRRAVTHAISAAETQRKRMSYAELVDAETRRCAAPPTTFYDNILLRNAQEQQQQVQMAATGSAGSARSAVTQLPLPPPPLPPKQKKAPRKHFNSSRRDACKIIATTVVGLVAFVVIATLSLSVQ